MYLLCCISDSHLGRDKTVHKLTSLYFWKGIWKDVDNFIKKCQKCRECFKVPKNEPKELKSQTQEQVIVRMKWKWKKKQLAKMLWLFSETIQWYEEYCSSAWSCMFLTFKCSSVYNFWCCGLYSILNVCPVALLCLLLWLIMQWFSILQDVCLINYNSF